MPVAYEKSSSCEYMRMGLMSCCIQVVHAHRRQIRTPMMVPHTHGGQCRRCEAQPLRLWFRVTAVLPTPLTAQ